ncbi:XRE family transcriptional regulator [Halioxenophilus aromaticivorans]|uniref:HTH cro/C1-type domain-containing protein n=1 Tax=Halioxenophilus aromaticivorans TaxID=1306992 RepID=A0AAV3U4H6_9ALTE
MKHPAPLSARMIELRELLKLSQKVFSDEIGITQGALSQLESGKSNLSVATLEKIHATFNVNCNWLVVGSGDIFNVDELPADAPINIGYGTIPLVSAEAHAGYISQHEDPEYISALDIYRVPGFEDGDYRLFEIVGDSMVPTLNDNDVVITEKVTNFEALQVGFIGVVTSEQGVVAKRIYLDEHSDAHLLLKSDNTEYRPYALALADVREVWAIKGKITTDFNTLETRSHQKIDKLEREVEGLKDQLRELVDKLQS